MSELIDGEYTVRLIDMPVRAGGMISESPDGHLNIYINARHSYKKQRKSFKHELNHAENDDLHSDEDIQTIEARADGLPETLRGIPHLFRASDLLPRTFDPEPVRPKRKKLHLPPMKPTKSQWDNPEGVTMDMFVDYIHVRDEWGDGGYYILEPKGYGYF